MKEKIKSNILPITFAVLLFTLFFTDLLKRFPTNLDELWNFNTARCIKNGLIPYKDISMITTPLLPTIVSVLLKITADQLLVFRVLHALLICGIFYLTYRLFLKFKINKIISVTFTFLISSTFYHNTFLDYNYGCLLLMLIIENIELKDIEKNKNTNYLIGLLAGLSILTKQTLGVFICLYTIIIPFITQQDKSIKVKFKITLKRILGISIPCVLFLVYLLITKSLLDFINYAVLGIKTFTNSITYVQMIKTLSGFKQVLAVIVPIAIIIQIILIPILKNKKYNIAIISSLPMLIVLYPICDYTHFLVGTLIILVNLFIAVWLILKRVESKIITTSKNKKDEAYRKFLKTSIEVFLILIMIYLSLIQIRKNIIEYKQRYDSNIKITHYENIPLTKNNKQINEELKAFYDIKKKEGYTVIIVDADACFYTIPIDVYNKNYDMFLKGNIGKDGEDGIIENIKKSSKTIYLLKNKEMSLNWQTPTKVLDYIRSNLEKTEEFNIFEVWKKE